MKGWFAKAWHNPFGSNVIAGVVAGVIVAVLLALWAKSGFSSSVAVIWASTYAWLAEPITVPFGIALLTLVAAAAVLFWLIKQWRETLAMCGDLLSKAADNARKLRFHENMRELQAKAWGPKREAIRLLLAIGMKEQRVMNVLAAVYPEPMEVLKVAVEVGMRFADVEKICEDVATEGFLTIVTSGHHPVKAVLTKQGRDYLMSLKHPQR